MGCCGDKNQSRPVTRGPAHYVAGAFKAASAIIPGKHIADQETIRARLKACATCEHVELGRMGEYGVPLRCKVCGCLIQLKVRLKAETCPLSPPSWGPVGQPEAKM